MTHLREALGCDDVRLAFIAASDAVVARRDELGRLDAAAGDGDLGVTMARGFGSTRALLEANEFASVSAILAAVGGELGRRAPSTLGTLLASAFRGAAKAVGDGETLDSAQLVTLLQAATQAVRSRGRVEVGQRTVLDAMEGSVAAARSAADGDIWATLSAAAAGAEAAAQATAGMSPSVGRAAWVGERARGVPDGGAVAWAILLRGLADAVPRTQQSGAD